MEITTKQSELLKSSLDFMKQLQICLNHFPRHEKFCLSQIIRNIAYELHKLLYLSIIDKELTEILKIKTKYYELKCNINLARNLGYFDYIKNEKVECKSDNKVVVKRFIILLEKLDIFYKNIKDYYKL